MGLTYHCIRPRSRRYKYAARDLGSLLEVRYLEARQLSGSWSRGLFKNIGTYIIITELCLNNPGRLRLPLDKVGTLPRYLTLPFTSESRVWEHGII